MKLVTTEAVMTALCQHCDSHIEMCEDCGMREIIEIVPSAWISCKDRLPEDLTSVIVRRKDGGIFIYDYFANSPTDECWMDERMNFYSFYDVTHWMQLPEFPEVEG